MGSYYSHLKYFDDCFFLLGTEFAVEEMLFGEIHRFRSWKTQLYQLVKTGLDRFDVSSPVRLQDYLTYLADEMDSAGTYYFIFRKKNIKWQLQC